jgi:hypothetical protein
MYSVAIATIAPADANLLVLCDSYNRAKDSISGKRIGMPILYYKADPMRKGHQFPENPTKPNTYDSRDNQWLVNLRPDWMDAAFAHPMASDTGNWQQANGPTSAGGIATPEVFYRETLNEKISQQTSGLTRRPYRENTYILMSAGKDGEYGTEDDIFNFDN